MTSTKLRITLTLVMVMGLALVPATSDAGKVRIKATDSRTWSPDFKHVPPGTKVIWKNPTTSSHTVTAYSSNWSKNTSLPAGERTSKRFKKKGTFKYRCTIHSTLVDGDCDGMCGVVHVAD